MRIVTAQTPDGLVVRRIWPSGEDAFRFNRDGSCAYSADHKPGGWVSVNAIYVPAEVLRAFAEATSPKEKHP